VTGMSDEPPERPKTAPRAHSSRDNALDVHTVVSAERGQWVVEIVVIFADGVVRKRISTYHTRAQAELAARLIKRGAEREI